MGHLLNVSPRVPVAGSQSSATLGPDIRSVTRMFFAGRAGITPAGHGWRA